MKLYIMVTNDVYELPLAVADSINELARFAGVKPNSIKTALSRVKHGAQAWSKYKCVDFGDDRELTRLISGEKKNYSGRPKKMLPRSFADTVRAWKNGDLTTAQAAARFGMRASMWYYYSAIAIQIISKTQSTT